MQPTIRQTVKYFGLLLTLLLVVNLSLRVYHSKGVACDIDDKVILADNYHYHTHSLTHSNSNSNSNSYPDSIQKPLSHSLTSATATSATATSTTATSSEYCCPKVYIYDPRIIQQKAQLLSDQPLHLTHLDPLNLAETFTNIPYSGNTSIPLNDRVKVLSQLLRWIPDPEEITQSLIEPNNDSISKIWYSKDFVNIFSMRVALSNCVTNDPKEAELFLVPMSVHTDHAHGRKTPLSKHWDVLFASLTDYQLLFEHFSSKTASKHIIFSSSFGHSRRSIGLWHPPYADPRVAVMQRVALGSECLISQTYRPFHNFIKVPMHVHSVPFTSLLPYPENYFEELKNRTSHSSISDSSSPPLVSAFFGIHARSEIRALRTKLLSICGKSPNCTTTSLKGKSEPVKTARKDGILAIFATKMQSSFCLEPEGDWPTRQSMVQDILLGCIPVFFSNNHLRLWPAFWGNFIDSVSVTFDSDAVMSGKVDIIESLKSISAEEISRKKSIMLAHKHQFDFLHTNDYMSTGNNYQHTCSVDAANLLLHDLVEQSKRQRNS